MANKTPFFTRIDATVQEKFRKLIQDKYKKYEKGLLSYEVEQALRHWLSLHTNAQDGLEVKKPNPTPGVMVVFNSVRNYLLSNYYFELLNGQQISRSHLEKAIIATRGSDSRTIEKWLTTFHKMGLVKPVTSATWEVM